MRKAWRGRSGALGEADVYGAQQHMHLMLERSQHKQRLVGRRRPRHGAGLWWDGVLMGT